MWPLTAVLILVFSGLNGMAVAGGGSRLIHLPAILKALRANPLGGQYLWVYPLLLSTLVPTIVHIVIATIGVLRTSLSFLGPLARVTAEVTEGDRGALELPVAPKPQDSWSEVLAPAWLSLIGMLFVGFIFAAFVHRPKFAVPIESVGWGLLGFAEWLVQVLPVSYS